MPESITALVALDAGVDEDSVRERAHATRRASRSPRSSRVSRRAGPRSASTRATWSSSPARRTPSRRSGSSARPRAGTPSARSSCCRGPSANGFVRHAFESGADDLVMSVARRRDAARSAGQLRLRGREGGRPPHGRRGGGRHRTGVADLRARAEGRHRQDAHERQPRRRRSRSPASRVVIVDLDLQFGDVGLSLGLVPTRTIFDLVKSGGSLDGEKIEAYLTPHSSGARVLMAPVRPDQASAVTIEFLRELYPLLRAEQRLRDRRHAARVLAGGDRLDRQLDAHLHGRHARLAVAQEHEARARDARAHGLRARPHPHGPQPGRHQRRRHPGGRRARSSGARPDVLVPSHRDVVRSVNEGTPIVQSRPRTEVAQSFRALADLYLGSRRARAAAPPAAQEARLMDLQERLAGVRPADERRRGRPLRRDQEPDPPRRHRRPRAAAVQHGDEPGGAARPGARRHPRPARARERARARGPRAAGRRDRRRHPRPRSARAPAGRRHRDGDHGQRPARHLGRAPWPAAARRRPASATSRTCAGSSTRWSPRSGAASTSPRRWSTRACPTAAA